MKLTREQAIAEHRKMWHWIAEETERRRRKVYKHEYTNMFFPNNDITNDCFCCTYDKQFYWDCKRCPIEWDPIEKDICCNDYNALYYRWRKTNNWQEAAALARQIAELPERKE